MSLKQFTFTTISVKFTTIVVSKTTGFNLKQFLINCKIGGCAGFIKFD